MRQRNGAGRPYRLYWSDDAALWRVGWWAQTTAGRCQVTLLATPALLLFADIIGRLLVPGELRVSVVSAFIGAPVLIFLVRRKSNGGGL
ncbi:iron-enterobactin transporter membrane protein [Salmonella enterica subsp. enterica serovar Daytona]|uniref:Iron-enterobactin transporter membrane protein n=1 Tax=Salmonella enterica subsp. enterica serovar Daytona TaxID=1962639 RepID=A0A447JLJ2_SALET|nr:iron-enterobactin transporter membrane protein [Salmonella enterica subsp. enterica serovar Daytona]